MSIQLFKDGNTMSIVTDEGDERDFSQEFSHLISDMIDENVFGGDWEFQLDIWLPQYVDICCKYRGYKNSVEEKRVLIAGSFSPSSEPVSSIDHGATKIDERYTEDKS